MDSHTESCFSKVGCAFLGASRNQATRVHRVQGTASVQLGCRQAVATLHLCTEEESPVFQSGSIFKLVVFFAFFNSGGKKSGELNF